MVEEVNLQASGRRTLVHSRVKGKRAKMTSLTISGTQGRFVPTASREVPAADFPPLPTLSLAAFSPARAPEIPCVLDAGTALHVTAGRFAIALALEAMGAGAGSKVLIPAYHCTTMVEPLRFTQAQPQFYRLKDDLSPDFRHIEAMLDEQTRVLMVTHYFGFPQNMQAVRSFCDEHRLKLLEDCAHAYFGEFAGRPLGSFGDFAIASPTKFFPLRDGGCLIARQPQFTRPRLRNQGLRVSLAAGVEEIKRAEYYGNLGALRPIISFLRSLRDASRNGTPAGVAAPQPEGGRPERGEPTDAIEFDPERVNVAMSGYSSWVYRNVARSRIIARRRENYLLLIEELGSLQGCRPLLPHLPPGVVPYEVPFWFDDLSRIFPRLEDMAVPMHRFGQFLYGEMPDGTCALSEKLSHHLVQFPCHQDLSKDDVREIAGRIRRAAVL